MNLVIKEEENALKFMRKYNGKAILVTGYWKQAEIVNSYYSYDLPQVSSIKYLVSVLFNSDDRQRLFPDHCIKFNQVIIHDLF